MKRQVPLIRRDRKPLGDPAVWQRQVPASETSHVPQIQFLDRVDEVLLHRQNHMIQGVRKTFIDKKQFQFGGGIIGVRVAMPKQILTIGRARKTEDVFASTVQ